MLKVVLFLFILLSFIVTTSSSEEIYNVGTYGSCYPVVEKDAYEEIIESLKKLDFEKEIKRIAGRIKNLGNVNLFLGKAKKNNVKTFYPRFTLSFDIKDEKDRVIYPAGYSFNPLDYVKMPYILVFVDVTSDKELSFLKKSDFLKRNDVVIIATKGNVFDASSVLGRTVYKAEKFMIDYLGVDKTPTYVYQKDNYVVIVEVGVYGK